MQHRLNGNEKTSVHIVRCEGNLDAARMVEVKGRLNRLLNQTRRFVLLDFARTRQMDLVGLGMLMDRIQKVRALKGDVRLFNIRPRVLETLRQIGAEGLLDTYSSKEEAVRSFQVA